jgi:hypothetical protein
MRHSGQLGSPGGSGTPGRPSAARASLPGASPLLTRAPYLTDVTSSSVRVTWATTTKNTGVVTYGTAGNCAAHSVAATAAGTPVSVNGVTEYQNSLQIISYTELWAQAWVYVVSRSTPTDLFGFRAATSIADIYLSPTGKLAVRNNVGGVSTVSTTVMPTGGWHLLTLHALVNGSNSNVDVSLDGAQVPGLVLTGQNLGTSPITTLQLGDSTSGRSYDIAFDDVGVAKGGP